MLEAMEEKQTGFLKLTLTVSEFQKSKINSHEISYKGKMYDFKPVAISDDTVELLVINDTKEETILEKINELADNTSSHKGELPSQLIKLLTLTYICPTFDNRFIFQELEGNNFLPICESILSIAKEIPSPPPESV